MITGSILKFEEFLKEGKDFRAIALKGSNADILHYEVTFFESDLIDGETELLTFLNKEEIKSLIDAYKESSKKEDNMEKYLISLNKGSFAVENTEKPNNETYDDVYHITRGIQGVGHLNTV